ncbi:MAG TPA: hypothetical protein VGJ73_21220 [Verrucomicrobiae bacterium]|jgi:hypothetical protein
MNQAESARLARIEKVLGEINTAIVGNDLGTTGIVKRLESVEKKIRRWELRMATFSGAVSASIYGGIEWIKHLLSKHS